MSVLDRNTELYPQRAALQRPPAVASAQTFLLPSITDLVFIFLLISFTYGALAPRLLWDAGIGWHIRDGQNILATRSIPHVDSFSATMSGRPWYAWEWLYDAIVGWIHNQAGLNGVVFINALVIAATLALVFRITLRRGAGIAISIVFFALCAMASSIHFLARPHVISWLLTAIWFWILETGRQPDMHRRLLWLPLLMLLWANLHGGFLVAFFLLGIYIADALAGLLNREVTVRGEAAHRARTLGLISIASALVTLINPYGVNLHIHIYEYLTNRFFMQHIQEFQRPDLHTAPAQAFLLMVLLAVIGIISARGKLRSVEWLLILFSISSGMYAARNLPVASMLLMMVCAPVLTQHSSFRQGRLARWKIVLDRTRETELRLRGHLWPAALIAVTLFICLHGGTLAGRQIMDAHFDPARFPVKTVDVLEWGGIREPIFTLDSWGGYFIYRLYPATKVFVDDRHDFYGEAYIRDYLKVIHVEPGWEAVLDRLGVKLIVLPANAKISEALRTSGKWKASQYDSASVAFERQL